MRKSNFIDCYLNSIANESEVPVIDLTLNDDVDHPLSAEKRTRSIIELCSTPPLDANGNEIMIATDTKTMQAVRYKKAVDMSSKVSNGPERNLPSSSISSNTAIPIESTEKSNSPILYSNLMKMDYQIPSKDQTKFVANYKRWMQYLRSYNGFRLFVQRNYTKTQTHTISKRNKSFIQSTLLKLWNSLSLAEKEQYEQLAELKWSRPLAKGNKSCQQQRNLDGTSCDETHLPSSIPSLNDFEKNSSNVATENVNKTMETGKNSEILFYLRNDNC